jgi:hypothetical protein
MKPEKKYVIKDLYSMPNAIKYICETTTGLEDIWHTIWPKEKKLDDDYKPKVFENLKEAKRYLKEIKREANKEWRDSAYIYMRYGYNKPEWDIYEF